MISNPESYAHLKRELKASDHLTLAQKFAILDALYMEARKLGHFTGRDAMDGTAEAVSLSVLFRQNVRIATRNNRRGT